MLLTIGKLAAAVQIALASGGDAGRQAETRAEALAFAEHKCLTEGLYFEAGGEGDAGMKAVAEVVLRRAKTSGFPKSVCRVIYDGAPGRDCQFSFACDGSRVRPRGAASWKHVWKLAGDIMANPDALLVENATLGATRFHADYVAPNWEAEGYEETVQIGRHKFYRVKAAGETGR